MKNGSIQDRPKQPEIVAKCLARESSFIVLSVIVSVIFWLTDAFIDSNAFYDHSFLTVLFSGGKELYFRLLASFFFVVCGVFTAKIFGRQKRAQEELRETRNYLQSIVDTEPACVKLLSSDGMVQDMNRAGLAMVEAESLDQVKGRPVTGLILPQYRKDFGALIKKTCEGTPGQLEFELVGMKGKRLWLETHAVPIRGAKGEIFASLGITHDITRRKHAEGRLLAALAEKEVLLKEIHHRVKNNLQVVASILDLQAQAIEDGRARRLFAESQKRIEAMSLIHEKLYRSKDLSKIDFAEYVEELTANIFSLHAGRKEKIDLRTDIRGIALGVEEAIPCGLIINELVTNALRHAFVGQVKGTVTVGMMQAAEEGMLALTVSDDGVGLPDGLDFRNTQSLGMQLVVSLVAQLRGRIELRSGKGTAFTLHFRERIDQGRNTFVDKDTSGGR